MEELVASPKRSPHAQVAAVLLHAETLPATKKTRWAWLVATFFGAGYLKPGPGTYGSVAAAVLWLIAGWLVHHNTQTLTWITLAGVVGATAIGIPAATLAARESGRDDPGFVVIDEVAGQWLALLFMPPLWPNALLALILFRFFDILKPPPIRRFEALPEGLGIMADDLVAGVFSCALAQLFLYLLQKAA